MVSTAPCVLIVDDELPIRRFLRVTLSAEGYRVVEAATAAEAIEQIAAQRPDRKSVV
jgi:two-component system KDP operon response regulator KdpE